MRRFTGTHTVRVALAPERALWLFTPEGERAWADGWDPQYPGGPPAGDGAEPGTVFVTHDTVWVCTDREAARVRYGRLTPGVWAGTVEVRLRGLPERTTAAEVTYDLTALSADGAEHLEAFAAAYEHDIGAWEGLIGAAL